VGQALLTRTKALEDCEVFSDLSETEIRLLAGLCLPVHFLSGQTIYRVGSRRQRAFVISDGVVGVIIEPEGHVVSADMYGRGEIIAAEGLFGTTPIGLVAYQALTNVHALIVPTAALNEFARTYPKIALKVMAGLARRLHRRTVLQYYLMSQAAPLADKKQDQTKVLQWRPMPLEKALAAQGTADAVHEALAIGPATGA